MALTLEQLQGQREEIISAMGQPDVSCSDKNVRWHPQPELEAALARVDAEIAKLQSSQTKVFTISTNRGLS